METNEIIKQHNILPEYAQKRVRNLINELFTANGESQNYYIHTCPKCWAVEPGFIRGGNPTVVNRCSGILYAINASWSADLLLSPE